MKDDSNPVRPRPYWKAPIDKPGVTYVKLHEHAISVIEEMLRTKNTDKFNKLKIMMGGDRLKKIWEEHKKKSGEE